ncbi:uncharacterized protein LOC143915874 [Arctopsyche grandis]|uniref:uncharacterized protein LOC143915874 n=1 Tax=Arctopsyche grandis TaxID=121162 RepID=UPI00406D689C
MDTKIIHKEEGIKRRLKLGWSAFGRKKLVLMTFGCETLTLNPKKLLKVQFIQRSEESYMLGLIRSDRKRNTCVRNMTRIMGIVERVKRFKLEWVSHMAKIMDERRKKISSRM